MNTALAMKPEQAKGLKIHGIVTLGVVALLAVINFAVCPQFLWFFFPLVGMSLGLGIHFLGVKREK